MLVSVAGLRQSLLVSILGLFSLIPLASCRDEVLFTSSVSYCAPPIALLVQQFDVTYFAANASVFFNISASSVEKNLNATAVLQLNVYGMQPVNISINLCDQLSGALCPLPQYNFDGTTILPLPSTVDFANNLPGIAYKIPDLEAFAQLTIVETSTGDVKACVQSTLSNGWSTRQRAVEWVTGGLAILALLSALFHSLRSPEALAPFRLLDLMSLYQVIGTSSLLNLNYPVIYRSFTSNFAWALGLFAAGGNSAIQDAINNMRHKTGGTMADSNGGSAIELVNRRLSPYSVLAAALPDGTKCMNTMFKMFAAASSAATSTNSDIVNSYSRRDEQPTVQTVTSGSSNVLQAGVPIFTNSLGIGTANAFMTVFFTVLILAAIAIGVLGIGFVVLRLLVRRSRAKDMQYSQKLDEWFEYYPWFTTAWILRLCLVAFIPVTVFAFIQWTLKDSWLSVLLSVFTFLAITAFISLAVWRTMQLVRRERPWTLYTHTPHLLSYGPLYIQYRHPRYYFFLINLFAVIFRGIIVAAARANGLAQVILLLLLELGLLNALVILKPHETRGGDVLATTLAVARVIAAGMLFAFVERFNVQPIPRVAIGIVIAVLFSLTVILMFINVLVNLGLTKLLGERRRWRLGTRLGSETRGSGSKNLEKDGQDPSVLEKGLGGISTASSPSMPQPELPSNAPPPIYLARSSSDSSTSSKTLQGRPRNPTPLQNIPLDPEFNKPYPDVTPTNTASSPVSPVTPVSAMTPMTMTTLPDSIADSHYIISPTYSYSQSHTPTTGESGQSFDSGLGDVLPRREEFEGLGLYRLAIDESERESSKEVQQADQHQ